MQEKHSQNRNSGMPRRHRTIPHLDAVIDVIDGWPEVTQVTPAFIKAKKRASGQRRRGGTNIECRVQGDDITGIRCIAHHGNEAQTFYVACAEKSRSAVRQKLLALPEFATS